MYIQGVPSILWQIHMTRRIRKAVFGIMLMFNCQMLNVIDVSSSGAIEVATTGAVIHQMIAVWARKVLELSAEIGQSVER